MKRLFIFTTGIPLLQHLHTRKRTVNFTKDKRSLNKLVAILPDSIVMVAKSVLLFNREKKAETKRVAYKTE